MKKRVILITLLIAIISMGVVSANDNVTNIEIDNGLDENKCSFNNTITADVNNSANSISFIVEDNDIDFNSTNLNYDSNESEDVVSSNVNVVEQIMPTDNIMNSVVGSTSVDKNINRINDVTTIFDDLINFFKPKPKDKNSQEDSTPKEQNTKNVEKNVDKKIEKQEPLPETGIPILPLILVLIISLGLYRRD